MTRDDLRVVEMLREELEIPEDISDEEVAWAFRHSYTWQVAIRRRALIDFAQGIRNQFGGGV